MCIICEDNGFTMEYYHVIVYEGESDYQWYKKPCACESGKLWKENNYAVSYNMASRIDKFVDKWKGIVYSRMAKGTELMSSRELVREYIENGRRTFEIDEYRGECDE